MAQQQQQDTGAPVVDVSEFMGGGFEAFYEDDVEDESIPRIQRVTRENNTLPLWGDKATMNINSLVLQNIVSSPYFKQQLAEISIFHPLLDEIYYNVLHLEPWERGTRKLTGMTGMCGQVRGVGAGGIVSSAFCLLFKLFSVKLTRKNLVQMINYESSNFIRGLGFLYIRYCQPPEDLWDWFEPYLDDAEDIDPKAGGGDQMTIGQMCKTLMTKLDWYSTLFPRIPVPIQKTIEAKFIELRRAHEQRKARQPAAAAAEEMEASVWNDAPEVRRDQRPIREALPPRREREAASRERDRDRRRDRDTTRAGSRGREREGAAAGRAKSGRCTHHKRHHHCLKHKLKCPRKATKLRPPKKPKDDVDETVVAKDDSRKSKDTDVDKKRDREPSKSRDRERTSHRSSKSRSPSSKRSRQERDRGGRRDRDRDRERGSDSRDRDREKDRDRNRDKGRNSRDRERDKVRDGRDNRDRDRDRR